MSLFAALLLFLAFQDNFSEKGMKALDDKRYPDAVEDFARAIAADPTDYTLHFNLALAYSLQGKDADAVPEYKKTLGTEAGPVSGRSQSGHLAAAPETGRRSASVSDRRGCQKPKEYPAQFLSRGRVARNRRFRQGRASLHGRARDRSQIAGCGTRLWRTRWPSRTGWSDAAPHFHESGRTESQLSGRSARAGLAVRDRQAAADAIAIYQQFPDNPGAAGALGSPVARVRQSRRMRFPHFQTAVAKSPTEANRAALVTAYVKNNQTDKALPIVDEILAAQPNDFELRMLHGRIMRDQRKFPQAAQDFRRGDQAKAGRLRKPGANLPGVAGDGRRLSERVSGAGPAGRAARRKARSCFLASDCLG